MMVIVTLYVPLLPGLALVRLGFCWVLLKLAGPAQAKLPVTDVDAVRPMVPPLHTALLLWAVTPGVAIELKVVVAVALQPAAVIVNVMLVKPMVLELNNTGLLLVEENVPGGLLVQAMPLGEFGNVTPVLLAARLTI